MKSFVLLNFVLYLGGELWGQTNLVYRVQKGDTLTRIATRQQVLLAELIRVNQIDPKSILRIGQPLLIPASKDFISSSNQTSNLINVTNFPNIKAEENLTNSQIFAPSNIVIPIQTTNEDGMSSLTNFISQKPQLVTNASPLSAQNSRPTIYTIQPGDNLFKIGKRFGVSSEQLAQWNEIDLKTILKIGQKLKLFPSGSAVAKTNTLPPRVEPLILESPKTPVTTSGVVIKTVPTNAPVKMVSNSTETSVVKVAEVVKPPSKPVVKPQLPAKPKVEPPKKEEVENSNYVFLQRVKAKIDQPRVKPGRWKYIVIHHSGTSQGSAKIFDTYHRKVRGMENGLAYHFVIGNGTETRDGEIEIGGRWTKQLQGGHLYSEYLNTIAIGICFVGDFSRQKPTAKQIAACIELVEYLKKICSSPKLKFCLHREINPRPTDCPGDRFPAVLLHRRLD